MQELLPLTAIEEYFLHEERPGYSWSFFVRVQITGELDRHAAEASFVAVVERNPLLRSRVEDVPQKGFCWRYQPDSQPLMNWTAAVDDRPFPAASPIDLFHEIGLRANFQVTADRSVVIFQFHHACCDGRGAFRFVEDWLTAYANTAGHATCPDRQPYDLHLLTNRNQLPAIDALKSPATYVQACWAALQRTYRFIVQQSIPLMPRALPAIENPYDSTPAVVHFRFDENTTAGLLATARRQQVTVNDLLCRNLLVAIEKFQSELQQTSPHQMLRLVVPVDLRSEKHDRLSAANLIGLVFITRRVKDCRDANQLLQSIHGEMKQVKEWALARNFFRSLNLQRKLPGGLKRAVHKPVCQGTAGLTNVGTVLTRSPLPKHRGRLVLGSSVVENVDFVAPIRSLTHLSIAAATYAGQLSLNVQYDPRVLSQEEVEHLLDLFLDPSNLK